MVGVKARVWLSFEVRCPACGRPDKHEPMMTNEHAPLAARFREIVGRTGGETRVPVRCGSCSARFDVTSFTV